MGKKPSSDTTTVPAAQTELSTLGLLASMADTTWRMFVPTVPLIIFGNWADGLYHTHPWLMLLGAAIGGTIAALLVRRQLREVRS